MKILKFLITFTILLGVIEALPLYDGGKIDCYIKHLKNGGLLDENYPESGRNSNINCAEFVNEIEDKIYKAVSLKYQQKSYPEITIACTEKDLKSKSWSDISLLLVVNKANSSLSNDEREQKTREIKKKSFKEVLISQQKCGLTKNLVREKFDSEFQTFKEASEEPETAFCVRKYVVENNLIDTTKNVVNVNPKKLSDENCREIIEKKYHRYRNEVESKLRLVVDNIDFITDQERHCYVDKYTVFSIFAQTLKNQVLAKLNISEAQRVQIKEDFVDRLNNVPTPDCF